MLPYNTIKIETYNHLIIHIYIDNIIIMSDNLESYNMEELSVLVTKYRKNIDMLSKENIKLKQLLDKQNLHRMALLKKGHMYFFIEGFNIDYDKNIRKVLYADQLVDILQIYRCPYYDWMVSESIRNNLLSENIIENYNDKYFVITPNRTEKELLSYISLTYHNMINTNIEHLPNENDTTAPNRYDIIYMFTNNKQEYSLYTNTSTDYRIRVKNIYDMDTSTRLVKKWKYLSKYNIHFDDIIYNLVSLNIIYKKNDYYFLCGGHTQGTLLNYIDSYLTKAYTKP